MWRIRRNIERVKEQRARSSRKRRKIKRDREQRERS